MSVVAAYHIFLLCCLWCREECGLAVARSKLFTAVI